MVSDFMQVAKSQGYSDEEISSFLGMVNQMKPPESTPTQVVQEDPHRAQYPQSMEVDLSGDKPGFTNLSSSISVLPGGAPLTQPFGARNSRYNKISGGVNRGADFAVPTGTPVSVPPEGNWEVVESFSGATASGPGNRQAMINRGYGNSVLVRNTLTGEMMRFSHLSGVDVNPGQLIKGGQVVGRSGATGHVAGRTGQHLDVEYVDQSGKLGDVTRSPYGRYFQ